ncbi:unnamed protein product [Orchesella dallaii]|uniref:Uncharacterized protein n=1 Tax=Orchesella dallaii TaxID=48710 RepID=A0ABP1QMH5_9HEXA
MPNDKNENDMFKKKTMVQIRNCYHLYHLHFPYDTHLVHPVAPVGNYFLQLDLQRCGSPCCYLLAPGMRHLHAEILPPSEKLHLHRVTFYQGNSQTLNR